MNEYKNLTCIAENLYTDKLISKDEDQAQTIESFSHKWSKLKSKSNDLDILDAFQRNWFFKLYGFLDEDSLRLFLRKKNRILDAGTGKGYKAAWVAGLAPHSEVVGVDISSSVVEAAETYRGKSNLKFVRSDISALSFVPDGYFDFVFCDQVIMHTPDPRETFRTLVKKTASNGSVLVYVYRKKALPRELVDTHFRKETHKISNEDMEKFSDQLTQLGKFLDENISGEFDFPGVDLIGVKPGKMSVQRFIYWNFLKCFWNQDFGFELSALTNFDWYSPSKAERYSKEEFMQWIFEEGLEIEHFNEEEACYSARLRKVVR